MSAAIRLPDATRLGAVHLQIADLARSIAFYEQVLGLAVLDRRQGAAVLGPAGGAPLVALHERSGSHPVPRGRTGLYHFAVLVPDRGALGRILAHWRMRGLRAGAADHLVSEALYISDPDGLGIEVYADRPRDTWRVVDGELAMASDPLDVDGLLAAAGSAPWDHAPAATSMGHVHLHVRSIDEARAFYAGVVGFAPMVTRYPGALFLAAGGYHHHLGTNTWAGPRATPPTPDEAQLLAWTIALPAEDDIVALGERLHGAGHAVDRASAADLRVRDPAGTPLRITTADIARANVLDAGVARTPE